MWGGYPPIERLGKDVGQGAYDEIFGDRKVLNLGFGWVRKRNY